MDKEYLDVGDIIEQVNNRYLVGDLMIATARVGSLILNGYLRQDGTRYVLKKRYKLLSADISNEDMEIEREKRIKEIINNAIDRGLWQTKNKGDNTYKH